MSEGEETKDSATAPVDKAEAKKSFLEYVDEQLKTATGKAKEGWAFIKKHADKVDINDDGTADLTQVMDLAKKTGGTIADAVGAAAKAATDAGHAMFEAMPEGVKGAMGAIGEFVGNNKFGLGGMLLTTVLILSFSQTIGPLMALAIGLLAGSAISAFGGDKNGVLAGTFGGGQDTDSDHKEEGAGKGHHKGGDGKDSTLSPKELAELQKGPKVEVKQVDDENVVINYAGLSKDGVLVTMSEMGKIKGNNLAVDRAILKAGDNVRTITPDDGLKAEVPLPMKDGKFDAKTFEEQLRGDLGSFADDYVTQLRAAGALPPAKEPEGPGATPAGDPNKARSQHRDNIH